MNVESTSGIALDASICSSFSSSAERSFAIETARSLASHSGRVLASVVTMCSDEKNGRVVAGIGPVARISWLVAPRSARRRVTFSVANSRGAAQAGMIGAILARDWRHDG